MPNEPENTICPTCKTSSQPGTETCANCGEVLAVEMHFVPNKTHRAGMVVVGLMFPPAAFVLRLWYLTKKKPESRDEGRYLIIGSSISLSLLLLLYLITTFVAPPS